MKFQTASILAVSFLTLLAVAPAAHSEITCERSGTATGKRSCIQPVQFDSDDDGVGGCVNQCKLDLEICLGLRPAGESSDRCDKIEDACEDACYNSGPDAGENN
ncbi:MAG: hypothetical protein MUC37_04245 [Hyphomicrobium sp.]|jgi:hypothetical protein|nr:hypothetical protein [Hyphomicrobium sp.]